MTGGSSKSKRYPYTEARKGGGAGGQSTQLPSVSNINNTALRHMGGGAQLLLLALGHPAHTHPQFFAPSVHSRTR